MKCVTPLGLYTITARPRSRFAAPAQRPIGASNATSPSTNSVAAPTWFERPLQAVAPQCLANNRIQDRLYGMGILLCKTGDRGGGGSTWIYDGDDDALPPSDFFSPTGPLRACVYPSPCYIPLRRRRHLGFRVSLLGRTLATASPLRLRERSGLSLSPPCTLHHRSVPSLVT